MSKKPDNGFNIYLILTVTNFDFNCLYFYIESLYFFTYSFAGNSTPVVLSDPVEEPPAGGGAPPPNVNDQLNTSPDDQPADSWEEAAVDGDPLLTPENEEVSIYLVIYFDECCFNSVVSTVIVFIL